MNVLVTGGAGYIGSHTCKALSRAGLSPIVLDNLSSGHRWAVKWGPLIEGDLSDSQLLKQVMKEHEIQAVAHFAASAYVGESMTDPGKYFRNNVTGSLNLLDAMVAAGVQNIVFSSSCTVYGNAVAEMISEDHPRRPINPYGESKLFIEKALTWYEAAHGIRHAALRYFNAAGADPDGELGEEHDPETHLIPLIALTALGHRQSIRVYGRDYPTPDGTAIRDYIHVTDLAEAHALAADRLLRGGGSFAVNLGSGTGHSVRQVIDMVETLSGRQVNAVDSDRRPGDPPRLVAPSRACRRDSGVGARALGPGYHCTDRSSTGTAPGPRESTP